ncbi:aromatic-ring-hydroxylating dioxygenase subunit beta [Georgenia sp. Z1491]|uniref:aromatic-ring-hydroxylating dioxygenase subunit beta n=1 Tax=Georgenia sp. Z1491 TaxID=3416707 RepID=UPI003CEDFFD9
MSTPILGSRHTYTRPEYVDAETHREISDFLALESELLDDRRFHDWVELVAGDFTYQMPTPKTPDTPFKPHFDDRSMLIDESRWSLALQWFRRFDEDIYEMAWGENPPVRFRHFITSVRATRTVDPDAFTVKSNAVLVGTRQSDLPKYITGERTDRLERREGELVLTRRWAVLDQVVIDFPQLRILL